MHILFVSEYYPPVVQGGGEINIQLLAEGLVRHKVKVTVLTSFFPSLKRRENVHGVDILRYLRSGKNPSSLPDNIIRRLVFPHSVRKEVSHVIEGNNIQAIHLFGSSLVAAAHLRHLNIPLFTTVESYPSLCPKGDRMFHGKKACTLQCSFRHFVPCQGKSAEIGKMKNNLFIRNNPFILVPIYRYYSLLHESLKHCRIIAISTYVQKLLLQQGLQSTVIPNVVPGDFFSTAKGSPSEKFKILYLGSLTAFKGPQILIKALQGENYHCDLYGDGPLKESLKGTINTLAVDAVIHQPVPYPQIPALYADTDVVVFPSCWPEPFGRIALEAMASSTAIIASNIGAIPEVIQPGAGILVPPGDVPTLKEALRRLASDRELRKRMGEEGKKAAKQYSESVVLPTLIRCYHDGNN